MTSEVRKKGVPWGLVLAAVGTAVATTVYVVLWVRHGLRGGEVDLRVAVAGWAWLAVVVAPLWQRRLLPALGLIGLVAVVAAAWGPAQLDFSPEWVDQSAFASWGLGLAGLAVAAVGGALFRARPGVHAAVIVLLAEVALLPVYIENTSAHVAGGWAEYPYPSPVGYLIVVGVEMSLAAAGAAVLARRWKRV